MLRQIDQDNGDYNLTSAIQVFTNAFVENALCVAIIEIGDGTKDLDGTGGLFEVEIVSVNQYLHGAPLIYEIGTRDRVQIVTPQFYVENGGAASITLKSPNSADTDVDVTVTVYDILSVDVSSLSQDAAAADNLEAACDNYSATRGLAGTALPAAAADSAGGLPISDAGGLDLDAMNTNINDIETDTADMQPRVAAIETDTNELQGDWTNGGRLDLIIDELTTNVDAVETDTQDIQSRLPAALVNSRMDSTIDGTGMESGAITAIWTTALTEAYRSTGATGTAAQLLYEIMAHLGEHAISGTTKTTKKLDGSTTAKTYTLDDATSPTSITETT